MSTHRIRIGQPLPTDVAGELVSLIGRRWPNSRVTGGEDGHMVVLIDTEPGDGGEAPDTTPVTEPAAPPAAPSAPTHAGPDRIELESQTPPGLSAHLVAAFGELIDSAEASNHVEMRLTDPDGGDWLVTICRPGGPTPHQARAAAAEARAAAAEVRASAAEARASAAEARASAAEDRTDAAVELLRMWRRGNHIYRLTRPRKWVWVDSSASQDSGDELPPRLAALLDEIDPDPQA